VTVLDFDVRAFSPGIAADENTATYLVVYRFSRLYTVRRYDRKLLVLMHLPGAPWDVLHSQTNLVHLHVGNAKASVVRSQPAWACHFRPAPVLQQVGADTAVDFGRLHSVNIKHTVVAVRRWPATWEGYRLPILDVAG
jgi:hypothetical protein